jgi:hypothetical protein
MITRTPCRICDSALEPGLDLGAPMPHFTLI